ncbi:MAG: hypothetical protein V3V61_00270 [Gammaproteobacteria bacterium]
MNEINAKIKSATITNDDHGLLSAYIHLDYGVGGQSFGGYCLYTPKNPGLNYTGLFIWRVLEIAGVRKWEDLPEKTIRVRQNNRSILAIGHILKDDWFCPKNEFKGLEENSRIKARDDALKEMTQRGREASEHD